ncbi:hypothetical protein MPSI1_001173 [Malassezia psittaci]|uniref:Uncharacterized protein n=1 Tax=Malassezia psittaci TaxID=1821823 RepID=A0AAF0F4G4_9BASI|nr:hypothetical protein MPSI1_001173 [Malassezia psittaci]
MGVGISSRTPLAGSSQNTESLANASTPLDHPGSRRMSRPRKVSSRVRSPSPTPVTPSARSAPRSRTSPLPQPTPTPLGTKRRDHDSASNSAPLRTPQNRMQESEDMASASNSAVHDDGTTSPDEGTGPGKRQRRPSTMYRPPEALTSEPRKGTSISSTNASSSRSRSQGRTKSPTLTLRYTQRQDHHAQPISPSAGPSDSSSAAPPTPKLRTSGSAPVSSQKQHTPAEYIPATFTRHGERIVPPPRRPGTTPSSRSNMCGILSPKPVRTMSGLWRAPIATSISAESKEDDDEDDDDDDEANESVLGIGGGDFVLRSTNLAREVWSSLALNEQTWHPKVRDPRAVLNTEASPWTLPGNSLGNESDGEEEDFHKTMLHDLELDDPNSATDSTLQGVALKPDAVISSELQINSPRTIQEGSPNSDSQRTQSPVNGVGSTEHTSDPVFQHALPLPRSAESHAHAGSLTLSLPFEMNPTLHAHAATTPPSSLEQDDLDAEGDTPLTPIHNVMVQDLAERATVDSLQSPSSNDPLTAVLRSSALPSAETCEPLASNPPSSPFSVASPLFDETSSVSSHSSPNEVSLHLAFSAEHSTENDPYYTSPETMMALTDLDRAWNCQSTQDQTESKINSSTPAVKRQRCAVDTACTLRSVQNAKRVARPRRMTRVRSRAS